MTSNSPTAPASSIVNQVPPAGGASQPDEQPTPRVGRCAVAAALGLLGLALSSTAIAATPLSPADGATVTTAQPGFDIDANTNKTSDGQTIEQGIVVYVYTSGGSLLGKCFGVQTAADNLACNLGSSLPNGNYAWHFIWTNHYCSSSRPDATCGSNGMTSPTYHFTVAAPATQNPTTPITTPTAPRLLLVSHGKAKLKVTAHLCVGKTCAGRVGKRLLEYRAGTVPKFVRWLS